MCTTWLDNKYTTALHVNVHTVDYYILLFKLRSKTVNSAMTADEHG